MRSTGLLDDADDRAVAARVRADRAELLLGQVPALAAEADALLDLVDRARERERFLVRHTEEVEREPLSRARPTPGSGELRDEVLDAQGCSTHGRLAVRLRQEYAGRRCRSAGAR